MAQMEILMDFRNRKPSVKTLLLFRALARISSPTRIHKDILYIRASYSRHKRNIREQQKGTQLPPQGFDVPTSHLMQPTFVLVPLMVWRRSLGRQVKGSFYVVFVLPGRFCVPGSLEHSLPTSGFQFFWCFVRCENSPKWTLSG